MGDFTGGIVYQVDPISGKPEAILNIQPNSLSDVAYRISLNEKSLYYVQRDRRVIMHYNITSKKSSVYYNASLWHNMHNMDIK